MGCSALASVTPHHELTEAHRVIAGGHCLHVVDDVCDVIFALYDMFYNRIKRFKIIKKRFLSLSSALASVTPHHELTEAHRVIAGGHCIHVVDDVCDVIFALYDMFYNCISNIKLRKSGYRFSCEIPLLLQTKLWK